MPAFELTGEVFDSRARKVRCDGTKPICKGCTARGNECIYAPQRKLRGPDKTARRRRPSALKAQTVDVSPRGTPDGPLNLIRQARTNKLSAEVLPASPPRITPADERLGISRPSKRQRISVPNNSAPIVISTIPNAQSVHNGHFTS